MNNLLVAENVSKSYGEKLALQDFSIAIPKGSIYGLLGPNGAGKTTLIRIINQITAPDTGRVLFDGQALQQSHISQIGYMPEERGLYKNMKVGEQVIYLAQLKGMSKSEARTRLKYWFDRLDIGDWWNKKLSELSKGMAQKIQFIVTVLHNPKLLIFDEPFSGFDPVNANLIRDEILKLRDDGTTIIFSTHRMESVEELCDHVALINHSKKVLDGSIHDIKQQFKLGQFYVELVVKNDISFKVFQQENKIEDLKFINGIHSFLLLTKEESTNSILNQILQFADVRTFKEEIPNMNQVFINTVKNSL